MKESAKQQFQMLRERKISPEELVEIHRKQIDRVNPVINAIVAQASWPAQNLYVKLQRRPDCATCGPCLRVFVPGQP